MSISSLQATQAYAQTARTAQALADTNPIANSQSASAVAAGDPSQFAALLTSAITETSGALQTAEAASTAVVTGEANLVDVVTSISAAEVSLETAIAIRNRMIEAYQEIMRMPI